MKPDMLMMDYVNLMKELHKEEKNEVLVLKMVESVKAERCWKMTKERRQRGTPVQSMNKVMNDSSQDRCNFDRLPIHFHLQ